ncbi:MAG TPA: ribonuclease III [Sedimenticola sp.]|nr:ribonuclease III [Sedimenticola sp.]
MREPLAQLSRAIGYQFVDQQLLERALTHRSAGSSNNERLEFLGDAILGFIIAEALYQRFPQADEGQLSRLRASLVKRESLAAIARDYRLGAYLSLGPGELRSGGQSRDSILSDAMEALLGAVYLDAGFDVAREFTLRLFRERIDALPPKGQGKDPKTRLQEYLQAKQHPLPLYDILEITGSQHQQRFRVRCRVDALALERTGEGGSRRAAEQAAARNILDALGES